MSDFTQFLDPKLSPTVRQRQDVERRIVDEIAKALIAKGWLIRVFDGEEFCSKRTQDPVVIQKAIMSTDEDQFFIYPPNDQQAIGWISFVYGNDGFDVASDWTVNLEDLIQPIVDKYA